MSRAISVLVVRRNDAPEPGMPSQFCIGAGVEGVLFRVLGPIMPSEQELFSALSAWCDCASLVTYDMQSGVGLFQLVDDSAPDAGEVIELVVPDVQPVQTVIIIEHCKEGNHE